MNTSKRFVLESQMLTTCCIGKLFAVDSATGKREYICMIIERPYRNNIPNISAIPQGDYYLKPVVSPKFGESYYIESVHNGVVGLSEGERTHILIHKANKATQLQGCLATGTHQGVFEGEVAVFNSGSALKDLINTLDGFDYHFRINRY